MNIHISKYNRALPYACILVALSVALIVLPVGCDTAVPSALPLDSNTTTAAGGEAPNGSDIDMFPTTGPTYGGTRVRLLGSGFAPTMKVMFGDAAGVELSVPNDGEAYVTSPPSFPGHVDVRIVNEDSVSIEMTRPFLFSNTDSDGDGLTDAQEAEGWLIWIDYFGLGFGTDRFGNLSGLSTTPKTSNPQNADTDGDGLTDLEEFQNKSNPSEADTDGDGLSDGEEVHRWLTSPVSVDTDGDARGPDGTLAPNAALFDGAELKIDPDDATRSAGVGATSPTLADTDGDARSDYEEFDHPIFSPVVAELPELRVDLVDELDVRLDVEYAEEEGQTSEYSTSFSKTETESETTSFTRTRSITAGLEIEKQFSAPTNAHVRVQASFSYNWERTFGEESTMENSTTTESQRLESDTRTKTEVTSSGSIVGGVRIVNTGDVSFALSALGLTLRRWQPGVNASDPTFSGSFQTVATLLPQIDGDTTLAPGESTPVLEVASFDVNVARVKALLANPSTVLIEPAAFELTDAVGRNFAFLREEAYARTANLVIDYANGTSERYNVATDVGRDQAGDRTGIRLGDALAMLGVDYTTDVLGGDDVQYLASVRGLPTAGASTTNRWLVTADFASPQAPGTDVDDLIIREGETIVLSLSRDSDGDGVLDAEEDFYGTSNESDDTDGDGITDNVETHGTISAGDPPVITPAGWDVTVTGEVTYRVVSPPNRADIDGDGLNDFEEREMGTDPLKADTDRDGLNDDVDAYPLTRAKRLFVMPNGTGTTGEGDSWTTAFDEIYEAVYEARDRALTSDPTDDVSEIWVAAGTYFPAPSSDDGPLSLFSNVAIYGGFTGTESKLAQRNSFALTNGTIISGDRNGNDEWNGVDDERVLYAMRTGPATVIDGFTITGADAFNQSPTFISDGAGLLIEGGELTIRNCFFRRNRADYRGGAIRAKKIDSDRAKLIIEDCIFDTNQVRRSNGNENDVTGGAISANFAEIIVRNSTFQINTAVRGGAIYVGGEGAATIENCRFTDNQAFSLIADPPIQPSGGAIVNEGEMTISGCIFRRNSAAQRLIIILNPFFDITTFEDFGHGGAIDNTAAMSIYQCVFERNVSGEQGGALMIRNGATPTAVTNCTFVRNESGNQDNEGTISLTEEDQQRLAIQNCIFYRDSNKEIGRRGGTFSGSALPIVRYCTTDSGAGFFVNGIANLVNVEPDFISDTDFRLRAGSPCIDRGNSLADIDPLTVGFQLLPFTDLLGAPRFVDGDFDGEPTVDIGAYEFVGE